MLNNHAEVLILNPWALYGQGFNLIYLIFHMNRNRKKLPAGIEYVGLSGITAECKDAIMRLLQYGDRITEARILSGAKDGRTGTHCFLLTVNLGEHVAVKSGFSSGYCGEGPSGLSFVLQLLQIHGVEIKECEVGEDLIERLDNSSLTCGD